jgi:MEDS: MEthanogen/methylotroph, DcmR Sensory domain
MSSSNQTRLQKLCSRFLAETDSRKVGILLIEIDDILSATVAEMSAMLKDVEQVLRRCEQLSGIELVKRIEAPTLQVPSLQAHGLHEVGFYPDDRQFLEHLTQFVGAALKRGDAAIFVATESHRNSLLPRLQMFGVDIGAAVEQGRYVALDVVDAVADMMRDGMPDPVRFMEVFDQLIPAAVKATKKKHPRIAIFGECGPLLCARGNTKATIEMEKLGNQLIKAYDVDILCGYFPLRITGGMDAHIFQRICDEHSAVHSF